MLPERPGRETSPTIPLLFFAREDIEITPPASSRDSTACLQIQKSIRALISVFYGKLFLST